MHLDRNEVLYVFVNVLRAKSIFHVCVLYVCRSFGALCVKCLI